MKLCLATLGDGTRDGALVASRPGDGGDFFRCPGRHATLLAALEDWERFTNNFEPSDPGSAAAIARADVLRAGPALRRSWQALFASAYGNRAVRVAQAPSGGPADEARAGAPLMYQGASDHFLGPGDTFASCGDEAELDFEPEIAVVTGDVPQGTPAGEAHHHVRLVVLLNDFTYRAIVKRERETRFGFVQGKPVSAMAPLALTPAALGDCWRDGVLHATAVVSRNGEVLGRVATHEMQYDFHELIAHAAATRPLAAGTLISSGTVSSASAEGAASLVELRALQRLRGEAPAPFLRDGDEVVIDVVDERQASLFGRLDNRVRRAGGAGDAAGTRQTREAPWA